MSARVKPEQNLSGVRALLHEIFRLDAELDALCIDDFPEVYRNFTQGMNRTEKLNQLLLAEKDALPELLLIVRRRHPRRYTRYQHLLQQSADDSLPAVPHPFDSISTRLLLGQAAHGLSCDRSVQWQWIQQSARRPGHELLLLPGARGQGHDYFLLRIHCELRQAVREPRALQVLHVAWPGGVCPVLKRDVLWALARTLGCSDQEDAVREALWQNLQHQQLILLHPCARWPLPDKTRFVTYYGDLLPSLLPRDLGSHGCKVIQPVEWINSTWTQRAITYLIPRLLQRYIHWVSQARSAADAAELIARLKAHAQESLPIESLPPLTQITEEHVLEFCDRTRYPVEREARPAFARRLMTGHLSSDQVLHELTMQLPDTLPSWSQCDGRDLILRPYESHQPMQCAQEREKGCNDY